MHAAITVDHTRFCDLPLSLSTWLIEKGNPVVAGEPIVELLTPGMTIDIEAPADGVLTQIVRRAGDAIHPGETLGWVKTS